MPRSKMTVTVISGVAERQGLKKRRQGSEKEDETRIKKRGDRDQKKRMRQGLKERGDKD